MKIATWNVNSVRARIEHVKQWLEQSQVDVLLLQETKTTDDKFPLDDIQSVGYQHCAIYGQPSYNGVAIISKHELTDVVCGMPKRPDLTEARVIKATVNNIRVVSVYVPNGQSYGTEKYHYKLDWLEGLTDYSQTLQSAATVIGGDYNIAPANEDVYDIVDWGYDILTSEKERQAWNNLLAKGYFDAYRLLAQDKNQDGFSWWDYRAAAFRRNRGMRIDMLLVSPTLAPHCTECAPDKTPRHWQKPSDHTPVVLNCNY